VQVEAGVNDTSPIVTAGTTVNRTLDNIYLLGSLFNLTAGSFSAYIEYILPSTPFNFPTPFTFYQNSAPSGNRAQIYHSITGGSYATVFRVNSTGGSIGGQAMAAVAPGVTVRAAIAVESGNSAACINGALVTNPAVLSLILDRVSLSQSGLSQLNGHIRKFAYSTGRWSNSELQERAFA
jgi:hypothetical protein